MHFALFFWKLSWLLFCSWTPKFFNPVRLLVLRVYGATITGTPFVHSKARIQIPWHLTMHHRACSERANAYRSEQCIMEGPRLPKKPTCTGTHDFRIPFQLIKKDNRRGQCLRGRTSHDNAGHQDRKKCNRRSSIGCHQKRKTKSNRRRPASP